MMDCRYIFWKRNEQRFGVRCRKNTSRLTSKSRTVFEGEIQWAVNRPPLVVCLIPNTQSLIPSL
jgi:hypothetical protein